MGLMHQAGKKTVGVHDRLGHDREVVLAGIDKNLCSALSSGMTAHAICQSKKGALLVVQIDTAILVALAVANETGMSRFPRENVLLEIHIMGLSPIPMPLCEDASLLRIFLLLSASSHDTGILWPQQWVNLHRPVDDIEQVGG